MSLANDIAKFLREFEAFDGHYVNAALGLLTADATLLEQAEQRLRLQARLRLIRRLLMAHSADDAYISLLDVVIAKSARLQERYGDLRRNTVAYARDEAKSPPLPRETDRQEPLPVWRPTVSEIADSIAETGELQGMLKAAVNRYRRRDAALISPAAGDNSVQRSGLSPTTY